MKMKEITTDTKLYLVYWRSDILEKKYESTDKSVLVNCSNCNTSKVMLVPRSSVL